MQKLHSSNRSEQEQADNNPDILIIIAHPDTRTFILKVIEEETPYHVFCASDSFWAEEMCRILHPQLFILEHHETETNGMETLVHLHTLPGLEAVPAMFVCANTSPSFTNLEKYGVTLHTPCRHEEVLDSIERVLSVSAEHRHPFH